MLPGSLAAEDMAAQNDPSLYPVIERPRQDYDAQGVRAGSFIFYPALTAALEYDDNVFASSDPEEDWALRLIPELQIESDWARHYTQFNFAAENVSYKNFSSENHTDFHADFLGRADIMRSMNIVSTLRYDRATEERGTANSFLLYDEPAEYDEVEAGLAVNNRINRIYTSLGFSAEHTDYHDTTLNGVNVDQDYRDVTEYVGRGRLGYELTPMTSVFTQVSVNDQQYADSDLDSSGYRAVAGVAFEASRLVNGEAYAGYLHQDFDSDAYEDIDTWTMGASLYYQPSRLLTLSLFAERETDVSLGFGSSVETEVTLRADYELRRNVILTALAGFENEDFEGSSREDDYLRLGASARYLLNRNFALGLNYRYTDFDSNVVEDYTRNVVSLTGRVQY